MFNKHQHRAYKRSDPKWSNLNLSKNRRYGRMYWYEDKIYPKEDRKNA